MRNVSKKREEIILVIMAYYTWEELKQWFSDIQLFPFSIAAAVVAASAICFHIREHDAWL